MGVVVRLPTSPATWAGWSGSTGRCTPGRSAGTPRSRRWSPGSSPTTPRRRPTARAGWIAELDGRRVGCVLCVPVAGRPRVAVLRILLVTPEARGHGAGHALVDACVAHARAAGCTAMTLWTNDVLDSARRIYEAAGFELVDEEPHHSFGQDLVGQHWRLELAVSLRRQAPDGHRRRAYPQPQSRRAMPSRWRTVARAVSRPGRAPRPSGRRYLPQPGPGARRLRQRIERMLRRREWRAVFGGVVRGPHRTAT